MGAYGDGYLGGGVHGDNFAAIAHYFQQRTCKNCEQPYSPEGIEFLREEPGVIVVKVGCSMCGRPLGIALVGMNNMAPQLTPKQPLAKAEPQLPREWSKRDAERLAEKPPINYDDVLAAHQFFASLGADWSRKLPRIRKTNRVKN